MAGELVERLRDQNYAGPMQHLRSWSEIDELFNAAAQRIEALERENATLRAERDEARGEANMLHDILDGRPAINAGLPDTYIKWSQSIYSGDVVRASFRSARAAAIRNMGGEE